MIDLLIFGSIIIIGVCLSLISTIFGIYFMITKKEKQNKKEKQIYKLKNQKEIK